ncbi:GapA-binding peptide SR1P [Paenactinomyces guangxiensis]|uniref:GapA-binding peptide SR1P n=1 Tax=Paenactinomyces guangxiensis TaxID=1490290 RepID=A0A7W2A8L5_9BACL|nr:GapA-binding peptide SR1P [Paenactinomyces guangxiensis]MBA4494297.1 GapA-binding peptide SR1P [Paenactinomyces guangxiensis]MBH8590791.1 GapA-binding peptide SR1P [Paenactinomyces guangxiensis]
MEAIICQTCDEVITYVESEKAGTLYGKCVGCDEHKEESNN